ncbi:MAG: beta-hydroxyacyl-ACP dehydratase, partial [Burkholderiaceae bacterium]
ALPGHFPGRPIVPGVLLLDWVLAGVAAESKRRVQTLRQVKFAAAMLPGETARVAFDARDSQVKFCVDVMRGGASVILATGSLLLADAAAPEPRADAP